MVNLFYVEDGIAGQSRTRKLLSRFPDVPRISCERYGEVFNPRAQNFRLQKQQAAMILAQKHSGFVLPAPAGYGIGGTRNYYFSHMLNCLYDCRYCFLQGMYRSAHYVLFVNYEDFARAIDQVLEQCHDESCWFFSGYDCDSLALEPVTGFADFFLPFFAARPNAFLELRTKSTQVRSLLDREPLTNVVIAFSMTPQPVAEALEHKAPALERRITALRQLVEQGWNIGLRFDPVVYDDDYQAQYRDLFREVFEGLKQTRIHSVSLGGFRMPKDYFRTVSRLYPEEKLFAARLAARDGMMAYDEMLEFEMLDFCRQELCDYIPEEKLFTCDLPVSANSEAPIDG